MEKQEQLIAALMDIYGKTNRLNWSRMQESLGDYKSSEVHYIEYIGKHADCNVTELARAFYMTSGAISKLSKKLLEKGVIESYRKPENKKEIYFRLTAQGQTVYDVHAQLHRGFQARDAAVFAQLSDAQFQMMLAFLEKYSAHLDAAFAEQGGVTQAPGHGTPCPYKGV
ncbi:MAG: MarR family transcriptional regulator [Oscillospiraceae bacterium]|jgi:DNA-binding MarR family transcriptional regulator|nr:MarR family transcriptional regulator [Oscillospiraceae bacterium]